MFRVLCVLIFAINLFACTSDDDGAGGNGNPSANCGIPSQFTPGGNITVNVSTGAFSLNAWQPVNGSVESGATIGIPIETIYFDNLTQQNPPNNDFVQVGLLTTNNCSLASVYLHYHNTDIATTTYDYVLDCSQGSCAGINFDRSQSRVSFNNATMLADPSSLANPNNAVNTTASVTGQLTW